MRRPGYSNIAAMILFVATCAAHAKVNLPAVFGDHMVLQRLAPIHIWGWAAPAELVNITFHQQHSIARANDIGQWSVYLDPEGAGGPYRLTVKSTNVVTITDVLVGDVWLASGQSNMEMPLKGIPTSAVKDGPEAIRTAAEPEIRLLRLSPKASSFPLADISGNWTTCTPETVPDFSAVAYFFGREIQKKENVPIGLIDATWGGTFIQAWISFDKLASDANLRAAFSIYSRLMDEQSDIALTVALEKQADNAAREAKQPLPIHPWHPGPDSFTPGVLFNSMIAPLTPFALKGVIWYQGESNSLLSQAGLYSSLFPALIADWRARWRQGNFPFLYVQISTFDSTPGVDLRTKDFDWGTLRDAQRRALDLDATAMAVSLDVGDPANIHPADKETVGHRLALAAQALAYGERVEYSGPLFRQAFPQGSEICVLFDHASGLNAHGDKLEGFDVASQDRKFFRAVARIAVDRVCVQSDKVTDPRYVRYAWANAPTANLYNAAGLPASTFTSEEQPLVGNVSH